MPRCVYALFLLHQTTRQRRKGDSCHDHPPRDLHRLWTRLLGALPPSCPSHTAKSSAPSNSATVGVMVTACISAKRVEGPTACTLPVATATVPRASSIQPSRGSSTTSTHSSRGRTASSPAPSLSRSAPASARINAPRPRRCFTRLPWPSHVRPVAHRCASSCDDGPQPGTLLRQAESQAVVLMSGVRHRAAHLRHPGARLLASDGTKRLRPGAPRPASVPQPCLGVPRMSPWLCLTMV
jgi:hypothetical protein